MKLWLQSQTGKTKTELDWQNRNVVKEEKRIPKSEDIEIKEIKKLSDANAADLKEMPGKKGEAAHENLHKTVNNIITKMNKLHSKINENFDVDTMMRIGTAGLGALGLYDVIKRIVGAMGSSSEKITGYEAGKAIQEKNPNAFSKSPQIQPGTVLSPEEQDSFQQTLAAKEVLRDIATKAASNAEDPAMIEANRKGAVVQAKKETAKTVNPPIPKPKCKACGK